MATILAFTNFAEATKFFGKPDYDNTTLEDVLQVDRELPHYPPLVATTPKRSDAPIADLVLKEMNATQTDLIKNIKVVPQGKMGQCYMNAHLFCQTDIAKYSVECGWLFWLSRNEKYVVLEHHALVKDNTTHKYIDPTPTYMDATKVWFLKDTITKISNDIIIDKVKSGTWKIVASKQFIYKPTNVELNYINEITNIKKMRLGYRCQFKIFNQF
jgi:hypothetical protein